MTDSTNVDAKDPRIDAAIKFMRRVSENDSVNRAQAEYWRKFRYGEQWPAEIQNSRQLEQRPCLTINKVDPYCQQVENQQRQQRPRIKVDPTGGGATKKNADIIKGMIRHIEAAKGGADMGYDTGFSCAITEGLGYWRVMSDYCRDDSFEQELFISPIDDPGSVYFDDHSIMPDGSDNEETLIVTDMAKAAFKTAYPGKDDGASWIPADMGGFTNADWVTRDTIRVAEYFTIKKESQALYKLSDGTSVWEDEMPPAELLERAGVSVVDKRPAFRRTVKWCKMTAIEILDERDLPGRWIPVFPCYGKVTVIDGKRRRSGLVKNAVDPQRMSNFWKTAMTESVALAPKAKWVMAEGQDEDHENEWANANISAKPVLRYKQTDVGGQLAPPPERQQPEPPPQGAMAMAQAVDQDLSAVLGIVDPAMRIGGNVSGKALNAERQQSDQSTFHFYDNMTRSIAFTGRYLLDVMPYYYNEPGRVVRIIGDDGKSKTDTINQPSPEDPQQVLNDVTVGQYDVVMDTGPGYNTKRQEAVTNMMPLFEKNEELMKMAGDVMFRNMDFPGAETIADRLAAANPLSQIDDKSDIPPAVQMQMKGMQQKLQEAMQHIQMLEGTLKSRADVEAMKQAAETHRVTIKTGSAEKIEDAENQAWMRDVDIKSQTALGVAEINQAGALLKTKVDNAHDMTKLDKVADEQEKEIER